MRHPALPAVLRFGALALALGACRGPETGGREHTRAVTARAEYDGGVRATAQLRPNEVARDRVRGKRLAEGEAPVYPETSRRLGEEGVVVLRIGLRSDGGVTTLGIASSSGHERLDQAALAAARTWRFNPRTGPDEVEMLHYRLVFRLVERS